MNLIEVNETFLDVYELKSGKRIETHQVPDKYFTMPDAEMTELLQEFRQNKFSRLKKTVVAANLRQSVIRVAESAGSSPWESVKKLLPYGLQMNENTHIFDLATLKKQGGTQLIASALPSLISSRIVDICLPLVQKEYNFVRLDLLERIIFEKYADLIKSKPEQAEIYAVLLSQGLGFRVLVLNHAKPYGIYSVSNAPAFREKEITAVYTHLKKISEDIKFIRLTHNNAPTWVDEYIKVEIDDESPYTRKRR